VFERPAYSRFRQYPFCTPRGLILVGLFCRIFSVWGR